jgi:hypothetical protein
MAVMASIPCSSCSSVIALTPPAGMLDFHLARYEQHQQLQEDGGVVFHHLVNGLPASKFEDHARRT